MNPITAAGFFDAGQPGYYLLILAFLAALVGLYLWGNRHKDSDSRAARLGRLYRELDEDKLAGIPDEELVDAVAANLLEKQDRRRPDPYHTITLLSRGRTAVYSVWLICNELDKGSFEDLYAGPSAVFDELAADGLDLIGAPRCAAALRTAKERISDMEGHAEELAELHADFLEAAEEERPLDRCVEYIRANPREFVDQSPDSFGDAGPLAP